MSQEKGPGKGCIHISIEARLTGKGRPRFGNGRTYTPSKTRAAESLLAWTAQQIMLAKASKPFKGAVKLVVSEFIAYPKSWTKKMREESSPFYTGKPDADNCLKLLGDAFNGVVWEDDCQVASIDYTRFRGHMDKVHIRVEEL